jgi:hypothetical protein
MDPRGERFWRTVWELIGEERGIHQMICFSHNGSNRLKGKQQPPRPQTLTSLARDPSSVPSGDDGPDPVSAAAPLCKLPGPRGSNPLAAGVQTLLVAVLVSPTWF